MKTIKGLTENEKKNLITLLEAATPQTITTLKDVRRIDKICTVIEKSEADVNFEDADFDYLKQRVENFPGWVPASRKEVIQLADKLEIS
jgi:hypothetical protein